VLWYHQHEREPAMRLAQLRGLDIDNPQGLHKVTLTR